MKQKSHIKLSKRTVFVFRSAKEKTGSSTDPTETSMTIITVGTGMMQSASPTLGKGSNPF